MLVNYLSRCLLCVQIEKTREGGLNTYFLLFSANFKPPKPQVFCFCQSYQKVQVWGALRDNSQGWIFRCVLKSKKLEGKLAKMHWKDWKSENYWTHCVRMRILGSTSSFSGFPWSLWDWTEINNFWFGRKKKVIKFPEGIGKDGDILKIYFLSLYQLQVSARLLEIPGEFPCELSETEKIFTVEIGDFAVL